MSMDGAETVVLGLFERIRLAMLANDAETLRACVAEDYQGSDAAGRAHDRDVMLAAYGPGGVRLDVFEISEMRTRSWSDTVLLTGLARIHGYYEGIEFDHTLRFLDVYARRGGSWWLAASNATDVVGAP